MKKVRIAKDKQWRINAGFVPSSSFSILKIENNVAVHGVRACMPGSGGGAACMG